MYKCENCGTEFSEDWRRDKGAKRRFPIPRFCSASCARTFSSKKSKGKKKAIPCSECGCFVEVDCHRPYKNFVCDTCKSKAKEKKKHREKSKSTLREKKAAEKKAAEKKELLQKFPEDLLIGKFIRSGYYIQKSNSLKKLGFDFANPNVEFEYLKVQKFLTTEIELLSKSFYQVEKENCLPNETLKRLVTFFGITPRTLREAISLSLYSGGVKIPSPKHPKYRQGHHQDWRGNDHFLRSNLEFELAEWLDNNKIPYDTETLKIRYFDEVLGVYRTGIPDFVIPDSHLVIETKGSHFYNPKNLFSRKKILNRLGYRYIILVDNLFFLEGDFPEMADLKERMPQRKTSSEIREDYFNQSSLSWREYEKQCRIETENKFKEDLFQKIKNIIETDKEKR